MEDPTKPYHGVVMNLNAIRTMSAQERRADMWYGIFLVTSMMFIPMFVLVVALTFGHAVLGISLSVISCGVGLAVGIGKRRRIIGDFFKVRDVESRMTIREVRDAWEIDELLKKHALAFVVGLDASWLCFMYNWLRSRTVLSNEGQLKAYWLPGKLLVDYLESDMIPNRDFMLVPAKEFEITPDGRGRFECELHFVGGIWFDDLVRLIREYGTNETAPKDLGSATEYQANKSQSSGR